MEEMQDVREVETETVEEPTAFVANPNRTRV
jgi:hypothetical protein